MDFYTPLDQDFIDSTNASRVINNNNNNNNNSKNYGIVFYENYTKDEQEDQTNETENELDSLMIASDATEEPNDERDDVHTHTNNADSLETKGPPDHHARRPMNAFLIFCKRHRAIVRDRFPNLENRSITKILGDWWAKLSKEEKSNYVNLAKEYKEAFFQANPDFKWYKLPAPPLRTHSTRPSNADKSFSPNSDYYDYEIGTPKGSRTNYLNDYDKIPCKKQKNNFGGFKLADEAQMGGLNSLMNQTYESKLDFNQTDDFQHSFNEVSSSRTEPYENMKQFYNNNVKRPSSSEAFYADDDDKKSSRSCKGKRYAEFMNTSNVKKQTKTTKTSTMTATGLANEDTEVRPMQFDTPTKTENETTRTETKYKLFDASDFDLDHKIEALPALSLEDYLIKRKDVKKKRKLGSKPKVHRQNVVKQQQVTQQQEHQEQQEKVVGSQKRKARKTNITRRELFTETLNPLETLAEVASITASISDI